MRDFRKELLQMLISSSREYARDDMLYRFADKLLSARNEIPMLYRYSPADYNNIRCIEQGRIFLSPIGNMNDIFEGLSCELDAGAQKHLDSLTDIAYIKSFSEDRENLLMWGTYADHYRGMCVRYNVQKLDEDTLIHLFPVCYSQKKALYKESLEDMATALQGAKLIKYIENRICGSHSDLESLLDDIEFESLMDLMPRFLIKSQDWSYEKEWRFLATYLQLYCNTDYYSHLGENDIDITAIQQMHRIFELPRDQVQSINFDCADEVYLGPRMPEHIRKHIYDICKSKSGEIKVYAVKLQTKEYGLTFEEYIG